MLMTVPPSILFASRGKGRGHALPDRAIVEALRARMPGATVTLVSYGSGASALRTLGEPVVDLELPEDPAVWQSVHAYARALQGMKPKPALVVSHEEFALLPLAKAYGVPSVFLTDWFITERSVLMDGLRWTDEVLFLDIDGLYHEPSFLEGKVTYVGCLVRPIGAGKASRYRFRQRQGIDPRASLVVVAPGAASCHGEALAPLCDLISGAFRLLPEPKHLLWVSPDHERVAVESRLVGTNITVCGSDVEFLEALGAADVVVTKGNRNTLFEADAMGVASVSVSFGANPIDDVRVAHIPSHTALRRGGLRAERLAGALTNAIASTEQLVPRSEESLRAPIEKVASRISAKIVNNTVDRTIAATI